MGEILEAAAITNRPHDFVVNAGCLSDQDITKTCRRSLNVKVT